MTRIYKSIAIIASLVCSSAAGESSVVESNKISNNFMNSVEQVNTLDNTNTIDTVNNEVVDSTHQRRELAWWNLVLQAVKPPCLPHHKKNCETGHGHCPEHCDKHSGGSGGGGGGSDSGSGGDGATTTQKNHLMHPGGLAFWMMIAAASAAAIAIGAMIIGSRRKSKSNYHPLKGSLDRRMKLFGPMADGCFEDRELCGAQTDVGDSANNMELSEGGSHYKEMV